MTRAKRLLRALGAGVAAVLYVLSLGVIAHHFGEFATMLFLVFTLAAFFTYVASWAWGN